MRHPERLKRAVAVIHTHPEAQTGTSLPALFPQLTFLLVTQFHQKFRMFTSSILARQIRQFVIRYVLRQSLLATTIRPCQHAGSPRSVHIERQD